MRIKVFIQVCLFLSIGLLQAEGFIAGTLVHLDQKIIPIERVTVGDYVIAYGVRNVSIDFVTHTMRYSVDNYIKINIGDVFICAALDQKFYVLNKHQWVNADELMPLDLLLCCDGSVTCINTIEIINEPQVMHVLSVDTSHLFCVSPYGIIVHNIEPVTTGGALIVLNTLSVACPPIAAITVIGELLTFGVVSLGIYWAHKKLQKNKDYGKNLTYNTVNSYTGGSRDPKHEDDDENECPHGIYEDAGYHHQNSQGTKSSCPKDGQKCLNNSWQIDGSLNQRVGIEGDKFVIFKQTSVGKFHGYTMTWKDIVSGGNSFTEAVRKTLLRTGLVSKTGKIIKSLIK